MAMIVGWMRAVIEKLGVKEEGCHFSQPLPLPSTQNRLSRHTLLQYSLGVSLLHRPLILVDKHQTINHKYHSFSHTNFEY